MFIVNRLVYWVGLMIIVITAVLATYFVVIPFLLPGLWHAARLPLALLVGEAILIIAVVRVTERYVRTRGDHPATDAVWPKSTQVSFEDSAFGRAIGQAQSAARRRTNLQPPRPSKQPSSVPPAEKPSVSTAARADLEVETLYARLLHKAHGDTALVERLIEYEGERTPRATRAECVQSAIERWEWDNR